MWNLLRALLFQLEPERAHAAAMGALEALTLVPGIADRLRRATLPADERLHTRVFGLDFPGPVGLAAGFDKDARHWRALGALGFGFVEVGTLTARAQPGNDRPRLFRLPADRALANRMGFNNGGALEAVARLAGPHPFPVGVNIGRTKVVANEDAAADYLESFRAVATVADYVVVNVSSPNTPGLRALQDRDALKGLLSTLLDARAGLAKRVPLLVKLAPDLSPEQLDDAIALALDLGLDGLVATNTTLSREGLVTPKDQVERHGAGGISGAPLTLRSRRIVRHIATQSAGKLVVIGAGGVMEADDAWELLEAGASLVQVYSGFVYGGPMFVKRLNQGILAKREASAGGHPDLGIRPKN